MGSLKPVGKIYVSLPWVEKMDFTSMTLADLDSVSISENLSLAMFADKAAFVQLTEALKEADNAKSI